MIKLDFNDIIVLYITTLEGGPVIYCPLLVISSVIESDEMNILYLQSENLKCIQDGRFGSFTLRSSEYLNWFSVHYSLTLLT